jgi:hypothetical protein
VKRAERSFDERALSAQALLRASKNAEKVIVTQ